MNRAIDVRTEMHKLTGSKPLHAAAGAGVLAAEALRELPGRLARWRPEAAVTSLPALATEVVTTARTKAARGYDHLAVRGERALAGRGPATGGTATEGTGRAGTGRAGTGSKRRAAGKTG
jgi:hypothetical protein